MDVINGPTVHDLDPVGKRVRMRKQHLCLKAGAWPVLGLWLAAGLVGALTPFLLWGVWSVMPDRLCGLAPRPLQVAWLPWALFDYEMRGAAFVYTASAAVAYWGVGVWLSLRSRVYLSVGNLRETSGQTCYALSIGVLLFAVVLLAVVWVLASANNVLPSWNEAYEYVSHGPWRRLADLRVLLDHIFLMPVIALPFATISLLIKPSFRAACSAVGSMGTFVLLIYYLYPLID
jgi:hypothetical protein